MTRFSDLTSGATGLSRRDALTFGGMTISLGALIAACGEGRGGDDAPGRVGNAPETTELPNYEVTSTALLRTASSLEYTAIEVYTTAVEAGYIPEALVPTVEAFVENHQAIADRMVELTEAEGGEAWTCSNPWLMDRLVGPVLSAITEELVVESADYSEQLTDDEIAEDVVIFATALENLAEASHQALTSAAATVDARIAHIEASTLESRQAAILAIAIAGNDPEAAYVSPALLGDDVVPDARGNNRQFAVSSTFGQTAQVEIKAGPPDQNGVRETFVLQTPAANSIVYDELACEI